MLEASHSPGGTVTRSRSLKALNKALRSPVSPAPRPKTRARSPVRVHDPLARSGNDVELERQQATLEDTEGQKHKGAQQHWHALHQVHVLESHHARRRFDERETQADLSVMVRTGLAALSPKERGPRMRAFALRTDKVKRLVFDCWSYCEVLFEEQFRIECVAHAAHNAHEEALKEHEAREFEQGRAWVGRRNELQDEAVHAAARVEEEARVGHAAQVQNTRGSCCEFLM